MASPCDASSSGLVPSEDVYDSSGLMPVFSSSSDMVPFNSSRCGSSRSFTFGK